MRTFAFGLKRLLLAIFAFLAIATLATAQEAGQPRRILIVNENDPTQPAVIEIARGLHSGLDDPNPTAFEMYSEYLDASRFPGRENLDRVAANLASKYRDVKLDAIVAIGPRTLDFLLANRDAIAPGVPLFFGAVSEESFAGRNLPPDVKGVVSTYDVKQTLDLARRLQPDATEAVVVFGSAEFDKRWEKTARADLGDRYLGFDIRYLTDLSLDGFAQALAQLPPDTVVLILSIFQDAEGRNFLPVNAAAKIVPASAAPVYSVYDVYVGRGILGGYMGTFEDVGKQLAGVVSGALAGDTSLPLATPSVARPIVDWRQIVRFGLDAGGLPENTEIRFRTPSVWELYRTEILATIAVILFQSLLITALIIQARRTRKAQQEVEVGRLELTHLSRTSLLGELSGAFAHELNQPLTAILANAEVGRRLLDQEQPDIADLKEILDEIVADDKRAAETISQLRSLLVRGEAALTPVDLNQVVTATLALAKSELVARQVGADFQRELPAAAVLGNFAQLQQIILNLIVNAAEAMSQSPPDDRVVEITVRRNKDNRHELAVTDNGPGLTNEMMEKVFKPFVSSKANGLGLGLAICRTIASAHGGTLRFDAARQNGARVVLSLPSHERQQ